VERSRQELRDAEVDFRRQIRDALAKNGADLDGELPNEPRENLFAIRGHLARANAVLDAENKVRRAAEQADGTARALEALAAWINGAALETGPGRDPRPLLEALNRSDAEIDDTRSLESEALAALPPDVSTPEAQFPALKKNLIVRIRRVPASAAPRGTVRYRQEVWGIEGTRQGASQVKRTIAFIDIEPKTGSQISAGREARYYRIGPGDTLENIYDEFAAQ
jgi:hypothetical protein